jgi:hypothetical protein
LRSYDGEQIGGFQVEFTVDSERASVDPGEMIGLNVPLEFPEGANLPEPGGYVIEILIDGIHQTSIPFRADLLSEEAETTQEQ